MKPARFATAIAAASFLAACAGESGRIAPEQIDITRRTAEADNWSRHLPEIYGGLMACLEAHPAQPAYAAEVVLLNPDRILVDAIGAEGSRRECTSDTSGGNPQLAAATREIGQGITFTPASMPEPFQRCRSNDPVFHRDGRLLGWVAHLREDCYVGGPAAQQNWRAFGDEPAWSVRVTGEAIVIDRPGQPLVHYPSRPAKEIPGRWTWLFDAPDGAARNVFELVILNTPCGETMADRRYDYRAEVVFSGQRLRGCAEKLSSIP